MSLSYFKVKNNEYFLESLQKYEGIFDKTISKYTGSKYTIEYK